MNILIIAPDYPDKERSKYSFVQQIVDQFALMGNNCCVIAPYNVTGNKKTYRFSEVQYKKSGCVFILRPNFLSFSTIKIGDFSPTFFFRTKAYNRAFGKLPFKPDVIYSHFWGSGLVAYHYASQNNIPLFVATGESVINISNRDGRYQKFCDYVRGAICVSQKNRDESVDKCLTTLDKCVIFPNAVNSELFYKRNKAECRKQLGLPQDDFIVAFVGWFNERKGSRRVAEAINLVGGVKSIFVGKGDKDPKCNGILFKGALPHEQVPVYLGAADCFVLPTLAEGCCNAVVEAMACGLPVISSNLPFNWDVLDKTNSVMVDPNNIDEIANAIRMLHEDAELCDRLAEGALKKAGNLTIDKRAEGIMRFINSMI